MVLPSKRRKLKLESLELRTLLDGNLTVSILQGNLVIVGDSLGNVATVEQLGPTDATGAPVAGGSFQIIPDENTSLNQGKPGQALTVSGVTGGVQIDLGAGNDKLSLDGAQGQKISSLSIETGAGADVAHISDVTVAGALTVKSRGSLDVSVDQAQADSLYIKYQGSSGQRSSADLSGIHILHKLDIEGRGNSDISVSKASAADMFLKLDGIKGELAVDTTSLSGLTVDGGLTVMSSDVIHKLTASDIKAADFYLKYEGSRGQLSSADLASSADLSGVQMLHKLDIESRGALDLNLQQSRAVDMFLKLDGIKGESAVDSTSLSGLTVDGGLTVMSSDVIHKLTASDIKAADFYLKYEGSRGQLSSADLVSSADLSGVQMLHKLDIESRGALDLKLEQSRAVDMFLKLDGIKGESAVDSTSLNGLTVDGGLTVISSGVAHKLAASDVQANQIFIKFDGISSQRSSADLSGIHVVHKLDIEGRGGSDISVSNANAVDMFLKLESLRGQDSPSTIAIADVDLDGRLDVASIGALDFSAQALQAIDMFLKITDSKVQGTGSSVTLVDAVLSGQLQISTGNGNDTVVVTGSSVKGPARFDGGGGNQDSLSLINDQFAVDPVIVGFESVTNKST